MTRTDRDEETVNGNVDRHRVVEADLLILDLFKRNLS